MLQAVRVFFRIAIAWAPQVRRVFVFAPNQKQNSRDMTEGAGAFRPMNANCRRSRPLGPGCVPHGSSVWVGFHRSGSNHLKGTKLEIARALGIFLLIFSTFGCAVRAQQPGPQPVVEEFVMADTVQPVSASQLDRAIAHANSE